MSGTKAKYLQHTNKSIVCFSQVGFIGIYCSKDNTGTTTPDQTNGSPRSPSSAEPRQMAQTNRRVKQDILPNFQGFVVWDFLNQG